MGDGRVQLNIKFGGKFVGNPVNSYIDGDICYSRVVPFEFSYSNLLEVLFEVGCLPGFTFFYLRPNHTMEDGLFMVSNDADMIEMFIFHDGLGRDIECFVSHPDVENDDEEELGWEGVPADVENDEEEELGGAGNGNGEEVQNISWEGGQCGHDDTDKGASDDDTDSDGACSGLRDSSSSDGDGDDIEDVVNHGDEGPLTIRKPVDGEVDEESDCSDDNCSVVSSSDEEDVRKKGKKKVKYPEFNEDRDMKNPKLVEGMLFPNVRVFRTFLKEFHVRNGCQYKYVKNESRRVTVKCKDEGGEPPCQWRLHASRVGRTTTYQIKKLNGEHSCPRVYHNQWASAEWLAKKYVVEINDDPDWKVKAMQNDVRRKWMLDVSDMQIYRAKRKALEMVEGAHGEQYHRLWDYCQMIRNENPGSCAKIHVERTVIESQPYFQRMFILFDAQAKGFVGNCRPIIGLDACFLKGPYGGQLMHAVGRDGNNQMYPIAMAVVESELKSSWTWFLELLTDVIGKPQDKGWVFISDRQKASLMNIYVLVFKSFIF